LQSFDLFLLLLLADTGRLVGTGSAGPMQARMAILKAARQLAVEANMHVHIRKFSVINQARSCNTNTRAVGRASQARVAPQVGAVGIDAKLDCDAFASTHSATSHYDRASFVGLAWRPGGEHVCCEIYSTGKANLPGSTRQRDLLTSFARMVSELLRHSDKPEVCERIPERLRLCHRPRTVARDDAPAVGNSRAPKAPSAAPVVRVNDLFGSDADWQLEPLTSVGLVDGDNDATGDGEDLPELAGF
jgi:TATA-box binding protein (TBP) (component of TFIID and TFIIIB)